MNDGVPDEPRAVEAPVEAWLWDPAAPAPAGVEGRESDVVRLERALSAFRFRADADSGARLGELVSVPVSPRRPRLLGPGSAALFVAAAALLAWWGLRTEPAVEDAPRMGPSYVARSGEEQRSLFSGDRLEATAGDWSVRIGEIGEVSVAAGSALRVVAIATDHHELFLERGTAVAEIQAEPGVFRLDTPAARTVDLGCRFRVEVDERGDTRLEVDDGRVSVQGPESGVDAGRTVYVPAGAGCEALVSSGPLVPMWTDAPDAFRSAVKAVEREAEVEWTDIAFLDECPDTLVLWHLLSAPSDLVRGAAWARLETLNPPGKMLQKGIMPTKGRTLVELDSWVLDAYREDLEPSWSAGSPW